MGKKSKGSRKGKKAWRKNINTEDIEDFLEISTEDVLSGGSQKEPSFFIDKSIDIAAKKKIDKSRGRVLWCDKLLQKNPMIKVIPSSTRKIKAKKITTVIQAGGDEAALQGRLKDENAHDSSMTDLWEDVDGKNDSRIKKKLLPSVIPAVEVEPSGCSFNPDALNHQDALARAVADEMQKIYQQELGPKPVPSIAAGEVIDDELKYFLEADDECDDNGGNEMQTSNHDAEIEKRVPKCKRVTRVELNRRAKKKEHLKIEARARRVDELSKSIDDLPAILQSIEKEEEEKHNRHMRRIVAKSEKLKAHPPRLGKYKYQPTSLQVLLSEEKTGSLRKLKASCTLVRDRFNSLEKRGLVVPSRKTGRKGACLKPEVLE